MSDKTRVLILGGGFGGLYAALEFEKRKDPRFEVTVVNRENFFLFTPMLHEIAASDLDLTNIVNPVRKMIRHVFFGPADTAVMGSSLGGVVSFYLAWQWPDVFGKIACLSSTFTYRDDLLERISTEPKRKIRIYLDSGWPGDNYEATRSMRDRLIWKGYEAGSELFYLAFPEAKHDENAWAARSPIPFQFLFGKLPTFAERVD